MRRPAERVSVLAIDIGGTKVVCARVEARGESLTVFDVVRYPSREHAALATIVADYLNKTKLTVEAVGIGVAGPVQDGVAHVTNLPWTVDARALSRALGGVPVFLLNDLAAHGHGLADVAPEHLLTLHEGQSRPGNRALIAAGTGLGQAILFFDGKRHVPSASEGGHTAFSPLTVDDDDLLRFLRTRYRGHVSWERVVSGLDGFRNLYDFLQSVRGERPSAALAAATDGAHDIGEAVLDAAAAGEPFAEKVVRWFVRLYGAETGNLALKALAVGGVYVGGGIAPRLGRRWLEAGGFVAAMTAKGRFADLLAAMPVHVVTDPDLALKGAARHTFTELARGV